MVEKRCLFWIISMGESWEQNSEWESMRRLRNRVWEIMEVARPGDSASRAFDIFILALIFLNVAAVILETVDSANIRFGEFLHWFEVVSVCVFTVEYVGRLWSCVTDERFKGVIFGRARFVFRAMSLIDLIAILPFYLPFVGIDMRFVRVLRLLRIVRVAKVGRYYSGLQLLGRVLKAKKEELVLTTAIMFLLLIFSASLVYYCEHADQPELYPNIPETMWWAVVTLTTVGYGDIYPITPIGKLIAAGIAVLGIGMFALPTGILGAGFVEEIQKKKTGLKTCPHCGEEIDEGELRISKT